SHARGVRQRARRSPGRSPVRRLAARPRGAAPRRARADGGRRYRRGSAAPPAASPRRPERRAAAADRPRRPPAARGDRDLRPAGEENRSAYADRLGLLAGRCQWVKDERQRTILLERVAALWKQLGTQPR